MLRIKQIHIKNFRSIVNETIIAQDFNIFVGLNDAGKSNILKALNLFFNNETDVNKAFDFDNDFCKYASVGKNKAKEIEIRIVFEIPDNYKDHDDVEWVKTWRMEGLHRDSASEWSFSPYSKVRTLLNRIEYKYVPAVKSNEYFKELLGDLYNSIITEANKKLTNKAKEYSDALNIYTQRIGEIVMKNVGLNSSLMMPTNQKYIFKELVFMTHDSNEKSIDLSYRGDGIKSMHIPAILKYISEQDNNNLGKNSIPHTYIWGYEEPENGLEMMKTFELADELYEFSTDVQLFVTTHSPGIYKLGGREKVKIYYVYKNEQRGLSRYSDSIDAQGLHEKIGLMPVIMPLIKEKEQEIRNLKNTIQNGVLSDIDTIFVEGKTDRKYLVSAIKVFSSALSGRLSDGSLRIITREENGCGTGLLCDGAVSWMHMRYRHKAVFLFDNDKEGIDAKKFINEKKNSINKHNDKLYAMSLQPTEDIKKVNHKIKNTLFFTIEHLLPYSFWDELIDRHWVRKKSIGEMNTVYNKLLTTENSIDSIINDVVENKNMKRTIIYWNTDDNKKNSIATLAETTYNAGDAGIYKGLKNTISELERLFL